MNMNLFWRFLAILAVAIGLSWLGLVPSFFGAFIAMVVAGISLFHLPAGVYKKVGNIIGVTLLTIFILLPVVGASLMYVASGSEMTLATAQKRQAAFYLWLAKFGWPSGTDAEAKKQYTCNEVEALRTAELELEYQTALAAVRSNPWSHAASAALEEVHKKKAWIADERDRCKKEKKLAAGYTPSSGGTFGGSSTTYPTATVVRGSTDWSLIDEISAEMVGIMLLGSLGLILVARKASGFGIFAGIVLGVGLGLTLILQYYPRYGVTEEVVTSALVSGAILAIASWFGGARSMAVTLIFAFVVSLFPAFSHYSDWCERYDANCLLVLHAGKRY